MGETKVTADELLGGQVRMRIGGDPDDFTVPGSTLYTEERKNMQSFFGSSLSTSGVVTILFPEAFDSPPIVLPVVLGNVLGNPSLISVTKTGFSFRTSNLLGVLTPNMPVLWFAIGRRPVS